MLMCSDRHAASVTLKGVMPTLSSLVGLSSGPLKAGTIVTSDQRGDAAMSKVRRTHLAKEKVRCSESTLPRVGSV